MNFKFRNILPLIFHLNIDILILGYQKLGIDNKIFLKIKTFLCTYTLATLSESVYIFICPVFVKIPLRSVRFQEAHKKKTIKIMEKSSNQQQLQLEVKTWWKERHEEISISHNFCISNFLAVKCCGCIWTSIWRLVPTIFWEEV